MERIRYDNPEEKNLEMMPWEQQIDSMTKYPVPKTRVGIIHLQVVKENRALYGMRRFSSPREVVEMVRPLLEKADREMVLVFSLSIKMEPYAVEVAAVGGLDNCSVDIRNIFKYSILANAAYIVCIHNHPSGDPEPSGEDVLLTQRIRDAGALLGLPLLDHIIVGEYGYYSFEEHGQLKQGASDENAGE